jgi:hypothetical protein
MAKSMVHVGSTTPTSPSRAPRKSSLGYILAPFSPDPSFASPPSSASSRPSSSSNGLPNLASLPRSLLSRIAYHLVASSPILHPSNLTPLLTTSRAIHSVLSFRRNPRLYHDLYAATFDTDAIIRRYAWISSALEKQSGGKKKAFDLFGDPKSWAEDYKLRWSTRQRMRDAVRKESLEGGTGKGLWRNEDILPDLWTAWFLATEDGGSSALSASQQS